LMVRKRILLTVTVASLAYVPAYAQTKPDAPVSILPPGMTEKAPNAPAQPQPNSLPQPAPVVEMPSIPVEKPLMRWTAGDASALLFQIQNIGTRGLNSADYEPAALQAAIAAGEGEALDRAAKTSFDLLYGDMRDGRTPKAARVQWLVKDTDADETPLDMLMAKALATKDFEAVLASIEPAHPEYRVLKTSLANTPAANLNQQRLIRANMDRWRWMPRKMADKHVYANVPEFNIRVVTYGKTIANYRSIVGKLNTQTPSLLVPAVGIVVHPPWYLPQSIIREEVGPLIARSPAAARARGYTWTGSGKNLSVIQQAGPSSALGHMKIDMPNGEAIFIHDTPNRQLFNRPTPRAMSHGCVRADRALELGILLGILQTGQGAQDLAALIKKGKTEKVPFKEPIPVAITYFTYGTGLDGKVQAFGDIYGRDAPVIAALSAPRPVVMPPVIKAPDVMPTLPTATQVLR
jgi:L,D-transpeptidase YcbB